MDPAIIVRPATIDDALGIATVHVRAWQETYSHLVSPERLATLVPSDRFAGWQGMLAAGGERAWVAESGGEVVGWITASERDPAGHPRDREVNGIYALARVHGSGTGQRLLDAAIGDDPAFLWCAADNPRASAFYRKNGFELDGTTSEHPLLGSPVTIARWVR
ncbi:MAG: GNAT family N-acetyltransferase [Rhodoglobus sp.]|nr:GNAT family N-acetyltransferase [Rhodoglobus sp.]